MTRRRLTLDTPTGPVTVTEEDGAIIGVTWTSPTGSSPASGSHDGSDLLEKAAAKLRDYFADNRHSFDLPLQPRGTECHCAVWSEMLATPYGSTKSYGHLAKATGAFPRPVSTALGAPPLPISIPPHPYLAPTRHQNP